MAQDGQQEGQNGTRWPPRGPRWHAMARLFLFAFPKCHARVFRLPPDPFFSCFFLDSPLLPGLARYSSQDCPRMRPRRHKMALGCVQDGTRWPPREPRWHAMAPRRPQDGTKAASKMHPRRPKHVPAFHGWLHFSRYNIHGEPKHSEG